MVKHVLSIFFSTDTAPTQLYTLSLHDALPIFTSIHISPPLLYQLLDDPRLADADLSTLRSLTICCAAASPARLAEAAKWFGRSLNVVYGMSEHPMISTFPDIGADPARLASCGFPWHDTRVEIRDADRNALPAGRAGEIWVSGAMVTEG